MLACTHVYVSSVGRFSAELGYTEEEHMPNVCEVWGSISKSLITVVVLPPFHHILFLLVSHPTYDAMQQQ